MESNEQANFVVFQKSNLDEESVYKIKFIVNKEDE
jgi:hypothetical protein